MQAASVPFATPRHECQTHAAWQTTQWHRETQASTLRARRHIHQHESVRVASCQTRPVLLQQRPLVGSCTHIHLEGVQPTWTATIAQRWLPLATVYATARYSRVTGRHQGRNSLPQEAPHLTYISQLSFFEGVAVNDLCIKQQRLNAIKFYLN